MYIENTTKKPPSRSYPQPLDAARFPDSLLTIKTVSAITGFAVSTIWRKAAEVGGDFPQPVRIGNRCTRWPAGAITSWLRAKVAA